MARRARPAPAPPPVAVLDLARQEVEDTDSARVFRFDPRVVQSGPSKGQLETVAVNFEMYSSFHRKANTYEVLTLRDQFEKLLLVPAKEAEQYYNEWIQERAERLSEVQQLVRVDDTPLDYPDMCDYCECYDGLHVDNLICDGPSQCVLCKKFACLECHTEVCLLNICRWN